MKQHLLAENYNRFFNKSLNESNEVDELMNKFNSKMDEWMNKGTYDKHLNRLNKLIGEDEMMNDLNEWSTQKLKVLEQYLDKN